MCFTQQIHYCIVVKELAPSLLLKNWPGRPRIHPPTLPQQYFYTMPWGWAIIYHCIFTRCQAVPWGGRGIHFPCIFTRCHMVPWGVGHSIATHFYTVPGGILGGIGHSFMHFSTVAYGALGGLGTHLPCIFTRCQAVPWGGLGTHFPSMFTRFHMAPWGLVTHLPCIFTRCQAVPWGDLAFIIHAFLHGAIWCTEGVGHSFAMHFYTVPGGTLG